MKVLVACEYSGAVRDAFIKRGHEALSCDLLPTDVTGPHYQGDLFSVIDYPWDLIIAHPPCTDLSVSGAKHFAEKKMDGRQYASMAFVMKIVRATEHVPMVCVENPVSVISSLWRKPDQIIQPWQFGHGETKATCLWLKGLPLLVPTNIVDGRDDRVHKMPPGPNRWKERSKTYQGIADAMAEQWG
jgi:site-specific DNA-cytosine methylase